MPPCRADPCPSYPPLRKALYVVELAAGFTRQEKLRLGDTVKFKLGGG